MPPARTGYSAAQIALHWIIAVLIVAQVVLHEGMETVYGAAQGDSGGGPAPTEAERLMADLHVAGGITVFLLALLRVVLRLRRGAPPPPEIEHPALRFAAKVVHFLFYAVILLMPFSGALAWFGDVGAAAAAHRAGMLIIVALLLLHVAGALYHHFVLKTDVMRRILRPERMAP
ncbi:MAG: cytochrome B [Rhodospirillaceae bacterium]|nr:cytochrome B [Rhodospirillaceae bacterium]MYB12785.1 cytochrome B [Rhodospirillaceae bacterium]MYI49525.1 cytochrome B [Rhodospirillaceae bacterium]